MHPPDSLPAASLAEFLEALPDGALWLRPILNTDQQPIDFTIACANRTIRQLAVHSQPLLPGTSFRQVLMAQPQLAEASYQALVKVYETGIPQEYNYYSDVTGRWLTVYRSRLNGGVLSVARDVSPQHEAAQLAARHLQSVIDHSQTGIFVFSPVLDEQGQPVDFRFKTVNRMVADLVGQTPAALTGAVASDWFVSYRETGLFANYRHTYLTGEPRRFDSHYNVDGFDVWFDVQSRRVADDVLVTFTDFTDLKQSQQAFEWQAAQTLQQTALLNSVLDSSESGIMAFEAIRDAHSRAITDFRFLLVNRACERILNMPIEPLLGQTLWEAFPGNWETGLFDLYVHTTQTGEPGQREVYYNFDGLDFWLTISARQLGDGFVVTFTDISALKRANKAVEEAAAELITLIDTSQTGMFLFTPVFGAADEVIDFRFKVANKQLAAYVGQAPETLIGGLGSRWFPGYMTNGLFANYRKAYVTGRTQRFDFHYDGDGIDVWLDIMATKMGDAVLVTFTDYTVLKKLQQQLENSIADLRRSNASLEQFAYVASHDLQEPLRKIQSFGDVVQQTYGDKLGEDGSHLIGRMQVSASRMSDLVRDLLAYSRLTTRQDPKLVSLQTVLERVLDDLDLSIRETRTVIDAGSLPTLMGDKTQLRQLLQNLLTNAIKFRPADGHPVIRIQSTRIAAASLPGSVQPLRRSAEYVCITVTDNGIGFDQTYAGRIFQVFQRLHGREAYEGTGIGLAIVQKVVDNHGGAITASSQPGQGATFTVYLPVT